MPGKAHKKAVSARQQRFMGMCAHNPSQAYGKCPPKEVAREMAHKPAGGYKKKDRREVHYY